MSAMLQSSNLQGVNLSLCKSADLASLLAGFGEFETRKDTIKAYPADFVDRPGLWIESDGNDEFYASIDLVEFFMDLLHTKPPGACIWSKYGNTTERAGSRQDLT